MKAKNPEIARQCVLMAIERIKRHRVILEEMNSDPHSSGVDIQRFKERIRLIEAEFGQQWENVESLLALLPETSENWDWPPVSNVG